MLCSEGGREGEREREGRKQFNNTRTCMVHLKLDSGGGCDWQWSIENGVFNLL